MQLATCTHCGAEPVVPCPVCGNPDTTTILYGLPMWRSSSDSYALGGCNISSGNPNRICPNCEFGFWEGHRNSPAFFRSFWATGPTESRTKPAQSDTLRQMFERACHRLDDSLIVVADEHALDAALDPTVDDRWWWRNVGDLAPVCSQTCRDEALADPDTVPFAVLRHNGHRWVRIAGTGPHPDRPGLVHLATDDRPVGVIVLHGPDQHLVVRPPGQGRPDRIFLDWQPDIQLEDV